MFATIAVWAVALLSIALILVRPKGLAEAWWACGGALALLALRLITPSSALLAVGKGLDVYLFLTGMMVMSELARREGVFDWLASHAVRASSGSPARLFLLIYAVGTVVTVFLSNDATAVVLTPAVFAAVRAANAKPLPYLLVCAFIANAASFVLPISNPANLVVYRSGMPPLLHWLAIFGLPSAVAIAITYMILRFAVRKDLAGRVEASAGAGPLSTTGRLTLGGIGVLAAALMGASALNKDLGAPAFAVGLLLAFAITIRDHRAAIDVVRELSWSVLPLVAGLFVIVEALNKAGALSAAVSALYALSRWPAVPGALASGFGIALLSNVMNNLPSGLVSGAAIDAARISGPLRDAVLLGVDLGPNLSVSGSLATVLWLIAIRREGETVGFSAFLKYGLLVMPPALLLAILSLFVFTGAR